MNTTKKVSQILILILIVTIFLSGCRYKVFNLSDFVLPDDIEFISCIEKLDTPEKICDYMKDNFIYEETDFYVPTPHQLWLDKIGDCNDFSTFAIFVANYHNYTTYQIFIFFKDIVKGHAIAVFVENGKYTYISNYLYVPLNSDNFKDIVLDYLNLSFVEYELDYYKVFDYNMNKIETGN